MIYNSADYKNIISVELKAVTNAIDLLNQVKPIIEKFNGKKVTKRIQTAITDVYDHNKAYIKFGKDWDWQEYYMLTITSRVGGKVYKEITVYNLHPTDDNRVNSETWLKQINKELERLTKDQNMMSDYIKDNKNRFNYLLNERDKLELAVKTYNNSLTSAERDEFEIKLRY